MNEKIDEVINKFADVAIKLDRKYINSNGFDIYAFAGGDLKNARQDLKYSLLTWLKSELPKRIVENVIYSDKGNIRNEGFNECLSEVTKLLGERLK